VSCGPVPPPGSAESSGPVPAGISPLAQVIRAGLAALVNSSLIRPICAGGASPSCSAGGSCRAAAGPGGGRAESGAEAKTKKIKKIIKRKNYKKINALK